MKTVQLEKTHHIVAREVCYRRGYFILIREGQVFLGTIYESDFSSRSCL